MTKEAGIEEQTDPSSSPLGSIIGLIREILENGGRVALWQRRCGGGGSACDRHEYDRATTFHSSLDIFRFPSSLNVFSSEHIVEKEMNKQNMLKKT